MAVEVKYPDRAVDALLRAYWKRFSELGGGPTQPFEQISPDHLAIHRGAAPAGIKAFLNAWL